MKDQDTICYKINESMGQLQNAVATGKLDVGLLAERLDEIRKAAQKMEDGLKRRKKAMQEHGIEEPAEPKPTGINTIANIKEHRKGQQTYQVTVKQNGELVYENTVHAGVISLVEQIDDLDEEGTVTGITQKYIFGHPLAIFYAYDQLENEMQSHEIAIMSALKEAIVNNEVQPKIRKQVMEMTNDQKETTS